MAVDVFLWISCKMKWSGEYGGQVIASGMFFKKLLNGLTLVYNGAQWDSKSNYSRMKIKRNAALACLFSISWPVGQDSFICSPWLTVVVCIWVEDWFIFHITCRFLSSHNLFLQREREKWIMNQRGGREVAAWGQCILMSPLESREMKWEKRWREDATSRVLALPSSYRQLQPLAAGPDKDGNCGAETTGDPPRYAHGMKDVRQNWVNTIQNRLQLLQIRVPWG